MIRRILALAVPVILMTGCSQDKQPAKETPRAVEAPPVVKPQPQVINIDAAKYGFAYVPGGGSDPAPVPGSKISFKAPPSSELKLKLPAGSYTVKNAAGHADANPAFTGWRYNGGNNWVWSWVIANAAANADGSHDVIAYGDAGGVKPSQSAIASSAQVKNFASQFRLAAETTVAFMIRDYDVGDNAGGVSLLIEPGELDAAAASTSIPSVPEPAPKSAPPAASAKVAKQSPKEPPKSTPSAAEPTRAIPIINIDARKYGFAYFPQGGSDPAPTPGKKIRLIAPPAGPMKVSLAAGTYTVTNAAGQPGANPAYTGWRYNSGNNWVWSWVIANNAANADGSHTVIAYGDAGEVQSAQAAVASDARVRNFTATFRLTAPTTVALMIRDYDVGDNDGGVALRIRPVETAAK